MVVNPDDLPPSVRRVQQIMAKKIEKDNAERVRKAIQIRWRNLRTAGIICTGILGIYGYTMWAVKQENIFDDYETPEETKKATI